MNIKMIYTQFRTWISIGCLIGLVGCSAMTHKAGLMPENGPSMSEVYENAMQRSDELAFYKAREHAQKISLSSMNTSANSETLFPILPNPSISLYVYPHLAGEDQAPVPGYRTAFFLYKSQHYALPGEVPVQ